MLFRDLVLYRLPAGWSVSAAHLEDLLSRHPLRPCGGFDMQSRGWVHCGYEERYLYTQALEHLLALGLDQKLLPASIINQQTKERAKELEAQQGHPVGRGQMRELKARVTDDLRARALTRRRDIQAWLSPGQGLLAVNTASIPRAEELVETLRTGLGSFAVARVDARQAPAAAMTHWLGHGDAPGPFSLDLDLELQAIGGGATIRYVRHALEGREIKAHLDAGMMPMRLGLVWKDRISFVLYRDLQIKRIRFLDVYEDENARGENANEQFDIDFALMTGELSALIADLLEVLGGEDTGDQSADSEIRLAAG